MKKDRQTAKKRPHFRVVLSLFKNFLSSITEAETWDI